MQIPLLSSLFGKNKQPLETLPPMGATYYAQLPPADRRPEPDVIESLTENKYIPDRIRHENWCYDYKATSLGKRSRFEREIARERFRRYRMMQENFNPEYNDNLEAMMDLEKLGIAYDDALHKSEDGFFINQVTNPIQVNEMRQAITQGPLQPQKKKGSFLSNLFGLGD